MCQVKRIGSSAETNQMWTWLSKPFRKTETVCLWWLGEKKCHGMTEFKISLHLMEGTLTLGSSAFTLGLWTDVSRWCYDVNLLKLSVTKGTETWKFLNPWEGEQEKKRLHQALKERVGVFVLFLEYLYIYIHVTYAYLDKFILVITTRRQFLERSTKAKVFKRKSSCYRFYKAVNYTWLRLI